MYLEPITEEVQNIMKTLKNKMSVGWDGIPINVIKKSIETLKPHLTFIFNQCMYILWGIFRFIEIKHH